jgi:AhpD family alkylhydroperoxidase
MTERITLMDLPKGFTDGLFKTGSYLKTSGLDPKLRELINYRVSLINGCAFCLDMHHKEALHLGESELRLYSVVAWRECPFYSEQEKAALAFAEALTYDDAHVDDALFETVRKVFSEQEIANLTLAITTINSWNKINRAFRPIPGNYKVGQFG